MAKGKRHGRRQKPHRKKKIDRRVDVNVIIRVAAEILYLIGKLI